MRKFDRSLRSSRSSYFATFRHQLTILSKTDALDEEKWLNMLGTFIKDWLRYESHFVHGRDSLVDILKERGLLSDFFFNDTATTEIYTLSLHDALPISRFRAIVQESRRNLQPGRVVGCGYCGDRSEEHTSELQSRLHLVCRLLLEKKKEEVA